MHSERRLVMLGYGKLSVTLAALAGFLLFTGAPLVRANESECEHRTERADHRLHEAIEHHGWDSSQAEHARHELTHVTNLGKLVNTAGTSTTGGGMLSGASGARNTTGTTTTGIHDKRGGRKYNC